VKKPTQNKSSWERVVLPFLFVWILAISFCGVACAEQSSGKASIPHLEKSGTATQLVVDGKPFLILGGELHNSSSSSLSYMQPIWPRLAAMHLNTVVTPVSWELLEPKEGQFDFALVDGLIEAARKNNLHLVFLWFGSWKNTFSSYVPEWVKRDVERFPRVQNQEGSNTERLSPFSDANRDADAHAFAALMRHLRQTDSQHTVIMVQVENEVGVIPGARDYSAVANRAFNQPVPRRLMDCLTAHRGTLFPEFLAIWQAAGFKTSGTWEQVFGTGRVTSDLFMAWNYARYINYVAAAGKAEYPLPMYVNAALIRPNYQPGQYNSGGPLPHSIDIWQAGAPDIDFFAPDIYFDEFAEWCREYHQNGNPLFIPEARSGHEGAANVFYAVGQEDAIGFSPFGIDDKNTTGQGMNSKAENSSIVFSYAALSHLEPEILEKQATGMIAGAVLQGESQRSARVSLGNYTMTLIPAGDGGAHTQEYPAGAMFLQTGPDEFLITGGGNLLVSFSTRAPGSAITGIASIDEEILQDGSWIKSRRLNGDEDAQGQLLRLNGPDPRVPVIYHVRLYQYR
jgi:Domain of unknown function (DUF5597)/Glycosyl hydrolases family 35